jgi:hypothetical protein
MPLFVSYLASSDQQQLLQPQPVAMRSSQQSHAEQVEMMNRLELWLPASHIRQRVVPTVVGTAVLLACVYTVSDRILHNSTKAKKKSDKPKEEEDDDDDDDDDDASRSQLLSLLSRRKLSYQVTNLLVNAGLGMCGAYYEYRWVPSYSSLKVSDTINGYEAFIGFAAVQLGYQLWSIPVGIFHVKESTAMILHHVAVLAVAFMSACFTNGFRYWTPFFYGLIELSSVPLAVMNMFKDRPDVIREHPRLYTAIRLLFCGTFLYVRVAMFVPRKFRYLRDHYTLWSSSANGFHYPHLRLEYRLFMAMVWMSSVFLLGLQLYWAALIVRGLLSLVMGKKSGSSRKKDVESGTSALSTTSTSASSTSSSSHDANDHTNGDDSATAPARKYPTRNRAGKRLPPTKRD